MLKSNWGTSWAWPEERAQLLPTGKQRVLHNRAHWAKFYMMKAGLVIFPGGVPSLRPMQGGAACQIQPILTSSTTRRYPSFEEFYEGDQAGD